MIDHSKSNSYGKSYLLGVQFHPESICTEYGDRIIENFRELTIGRSTQISARSKIRGDASLKPGGDKKKGGGLYVHVASIPTPAHISTADIFRQMFGSSNQSFWLDSADPSRNSPSQSSLSFMGAVNDAESYAVEYLGGNELYLRHYNGSKVNLNANIFEYLHEAIDNAEAPNILLDESVGGIALPFNVTDAWFGYIGYEARHDSECVLVSPRTSEGGYNYSSTKSIGSRDQRTLTQPVAVLMEPSLFLTYDHSTATIYIVSKSLDSDRAKARAQRMREELSSFFSTTDERIHPKSSNPLATLVSRKSEEAYYNDIQRCLDEIRSGETYEVCLTMQFNGPCCASPLNIYEELRMKNAAPYAAYIRYDPCSFTGSELDDPSLRWYREGGLAIMSSSPERYLKVSLDGQIESKPIKGTARRLLTDRDADRELANRLQTDEKSRAENLMIVDLVRNDFGRVCEVGSVQVPRLMEVETYASVHQLVSTIVGRLQPNRNTIDAMIATFPGGSMTGAPKLRTMEIIDQLEGVPRGIYSGTIGYIGKNNVADLSIVIRTAVMSGKELSINAGGAIVALSSPSSEVEELLLKASAVSAAINCKTVFREDRSSLLLREGEKQKNFTLVASDGCN